MGAMSQESMDKIVNDHFMYEATDDIEGVLRTFTEDAEHEVIGGPDGPLRGKAALRRFYERLFPDLKGERVEPVMRLYGDNFLVDETIWIGQVVDGRPFKLDGRGGKVRLRLLHVFWLRDGLIAKENLWFDFDNLERQLTQPGQYTVRRGSYRTLIALESVDYLPLAEVDIKPMKTKLTKLFVEFLESEQASGIILILCTVASIIIANSYFGKDYSNFQHTKIGFELGGIALKYSVEHWINDGLMAIFFLLIGLEIERELYIGELSNLKNATLPVFAAVGGMAMPALLHFLFNRGTGTQAGIGIPMATDIAFALGVLALLGSKVPVSLKVFLTALAITDDLGSYFIERKTPLTLIPRTAS